MLYASSEPLVFIPALKPSKRVTLCSREELASAAETGASGGTFRTCQSKAIDSDTALAYGDLLYYTVLLLHAVCTFICTLPFALHHRSLHRGRGRRKTVRGVGAPCNAAVLAAPSQSLISPHYGQLLYERDEGCCCPGGMLRNGELESTQLVSAIKLDREMYGSVNEMPGVLC